MQYAFFVILTEIFCIHELFVPIYCCCKIFTKFQMHISMHGWSCFLWQCWNLTTVFCIYSVIWFSSCNLDLLRNPNYHSSSHCTFCLLVISNNFFIVSLLLYIVFSVILNVLAAAQMVDSLANSVNFNLKLAWYFLCFAVALNMNIFGSQLMKLTSDQYIGDQIIGWTH